MKRSLLIALCSAVMMATILCIFWIQMGFQAVHDEARRGRDQRLVFLEKNKNAQSSSGIGPVLERYSGNAALPFSYNPSAVFNMPSGGKCLVSHIVQADIGILEDLGVTKIAQLPSGDLSEGSVSISEQLAFAAFGSAVGALGRSLEVNTQEGPSIFPASSVKVAAVHRVENPAGSWMFNLPGIVLLKGTLKFASPGYIFSADWKSIAAIEADLPKLLGLAPGETKTFAISLGALSGNDYYMRDLILTNDSIGKGMLIIAGFIAALSLFCFSCFFAVKVASEMRTLALFRALGENRARVIARYLLNMLVSINAGILVGIIAFVPLSRMVEDGIRPYLFSFVPTGHQGLGTQEAILLCVVITLAINVLAVCVLYFTGRIYTSASIRDDLRVAE